MAQTETKVLTVHIPLPLAEKVDQIAARLDRETGIVDLARPGGRTRAPDPRDPGRSGCRPFHRPLGRAGLGWQPEHRQTATAATL